MYSNATAEATYNGKLSYYNIDAEVPNAHYETSGLGQLTVLTTFLEVLGVYVYSSLALAAPFERKSWAWDIASTD